MADSLEFSSTQTALALLLPEELSQQVNDFRSRHDKAYCKWPAHINIVYPFVASQELDSVMEALQRCLENDVEGPIDIDCTSLNVFKHKKSGILFLQPDESATDQLIKLRRSIITSLTYQEASAIHMAEVRPHLTLGQADTSRSAMDKLLKEAENLVGLKWTAVSLAILKRTAAGGPMRIVEQMPLRHSKSAAKSNLPFSDWRSCFRLSVDPDWISPPVARDATTSANVLVTSVILMGEDLRADFASRLSIVTKMLDRLQHTITDGPKVLCLQQVSSVTLPLILEDATICHLYPFSTHVSTASLSSHGNSITLASHPFTHFTHQFAESHKSAIIISLSCLPVSIANVHLSNELSTEAIERERRQMSSLTAFLTRRMLLDQTVIVGTFNTPTSFKTMESALANDVITKQDLHVMREEVISKEWQDAFLVQSTSQKAEHDNIHKIWTGEQGATFDPLVNHLAIIKTTRLDDRPQRYDRILYRKPGGLHLRDYLMNRLAGARGDFASDHFTISAVLTVDHCPTAQASVVHIESLNHLRQLSIGDEHVHQNEVGFIDDETTVEDLLDDSTLPESPGADGLDSWFIARFLKLRGLYSNIFGLSDVHIDMMLHHLFKSTAKKREDLSAASIIRTFFSYYSKFDWSQPIARELLDCSVFTKRLLTREFRTASDALDKGNWIWCLRPVNESVSDFLNNADAFIQVKMTIWSLKNTSSTALPPIIKGVEEKLPFVYDKLNSEKAIDVHVWPMIFTSNDISKDKASCNYLISVTGHWIHDTKTKLDMKRLAQIASSLSNVIKRSNTWNSSIVGLQCSAVAQKTILEQGLTLGEWYRIQEQLATRNQGNRPNSSIDHAISTSLRPAQDILNRILWDTDNYDADDFTVGYLDRFEGIMESPLVNWKRECTDEEFIPMHRIAWIKKNGGDGEKVWDRATRFDSVFGSGRSQS